MKIKGILHSLSSKEELCLVTDPSLTRQVFDTFQEFLPEPQKRDVEFFDGMLRLKLYEGGLPREAAEAFEQILADAWLAVEKAEQRRLDHLQAVSNSVGWPLIEKAV